jgi:hypothetical protein
MKNVIWLHETGEKLGKFNSIYGEVVVILSA